MMTREQLIQKQASLRVFQARADVAFAPWGMRAPEPAIDADPDRYQRRLMIMAKRQLPHGHELRDLEVNQLPANTLPIYEPMLFKACHDAALRPDAVPEGELRRVEKIDGNGNKVIDFVGQRSFVHDFTTPGRRVVSFTCGERGRYDAIKARWF
jgi:hypothetical protein